MTKDQSRSGRRYWQFLHLTSFALLRSFKTHLSRSRRRLLAFTILLFAALIPFQNCGSRSFVEIDSVTIMAADSSTRLAANEENSGVGNSTSTSKDPSASGQARSPSSVDSIQIQSCAKIPADSCARWTFENKNGEATLIKNFQATLIEAGDLGEHQIQGKTYRLLYFMHTSSSTESQLSIVSISQQKQIAVARGIQGYPAWNTDLGLLYGPEKKIYPFIAPGYTPNFDQNSWMWYCQFKPELVDLNSTPTASPTQCGSGFQRHTLDFVDNNGKPAYEVAATKHGGFWLDDVNQDGWQDISFPYFQGYVVTFSGSNGAKLGLAHMDVAAAEGDYPPHYYAGKVPFFHGGRFYGGFFRAKTSTQNTQVVVAGDIVGRFEDGEWCNSTRYVAGLKWNNGFQMGWVKYVGWLRTLFNDDGSVSRQGNETSKCIHRISDSVLNENDRSYVIFNQFDTTDPSTICNRHALYYQANIASTEAAETYRTCLNSLGTSKPGAWHLQILDAHSGQALSQLPNHYVWGRVDGVWPGTTQATFLLNESHPQTNFKQSRENMKTLVLATVVNGQFSPLSVLRCPSQSPKFKEGTRGGSSFGSYPDGKNTSNANVGLRVINTKDIDADGLMDIELQNGEWIGYKNGQFIAKSGSSSCLQRVRIEWEASGLLACRVDNGAVFVSGNNNSDRSGAWPTAPMSGGFTTADLNQDVRVNFNCTSPDGFKNGVEDLKMNLHLTPTSSDGSWQSGGAVACGISNGAQVLHGGTGTGEAMMGYFTSGGAASPLSFHMDCASPWGWSQGINDRGLKVRVIPQ